MSSTSVSTPKMWAAGRPVDALTGDTYPVVDPSTEEVIAHAPAGQRADAARAVQAARSAQDQGSWADRPASERAEVVRALAGLVASEARTSDWAALESSNSGATLRRTTFLDVPFAADCLSAFADQADLVPWTTELPQLATAPTARNSVERRPVGVVAGIVPFNVPLVMAVWKIAPALLAGCSVVLKPSPLTPLTALALGQVIHESGLLPSGVLNVVTGPSADVGDELVRSGEVDKVSFTGSTATGRAIARAASATFKSLTLELGGKSASVVCADANIDLAVDGTLFAAFHGAGQVCVAGTRLYVHADIYDEFTAQLIAKTADLRVGPAGDFSTQVGPLASSAQRRRVLGFLERAQQRGSRPAVGGTAVNPTGDGHGFYVAPTVFLNVDDDCELMRDEIFGPVLAVTRWHHTEDLLQRVNRNGYGLAAGVWSADLDAATQLGRRLRAGTVWINDWHLLRVDAPFGGFGDSGLGREFGVEGILSHTQAQHLHVESTTDRAAHPVFDVVLG